MKVAFIFIFLASLNSTLGNLLLKVSRKNLLQSSSLTDQYISVTFIGALTFYGLNVFLFAKALDHLPVSIGYPILAASGFAMLTVMSWFFLGEQINMIKVMGILVIIIGIFMVSSAAKS